MTSETVIDVRYPDCDRMGIVHHAVYPVWYEIARMDFFAKMGFSYSDMNALGINPPMVDLHLQYKNTVTYPGTVVVHTSITEYAPKKLRLHYETFYKDALVNVCDSFHIWTGPDMKSLDMQKNLPDIYAKIEDAAK